MKIKENGKLDFEKPIRNMNFCEAASMLIILRDTAEKNTVARLVLEDAERELKFCSNVESFEDFVRRNL